MEFEKLMIEKIDNGIELDESELKTLVFECEELDTIYGDNRRWSRAVTTIVKLCDRTFAIDWDEGLTEMQENAFYDQPYEVKLHEYEKTITVKEWLKVKK